MDQLVEYLHSSDPEHVIVGKDNCNLLIFGDGTKRCTSIRALALVIGSDAEIQDKTICNLREKYKADKTFQQLFSTGKRMAQLADLSFVMVAYQHHPVQRINKQVIDSMRFLIKEVIPNKKPVILSNDECVAFFNRMIGISYMDAGTSKRKNKRLADAFHVWSRMKLSAFIVKQDFDAIYCRNGCYATIEVKRSSAQSLESWAPYPDDCMNYDIQSQFSNEIRAPFYTFHHSESPCGAETKVGCYRVFSVDPQASKQWIKYKKEIIEARMILDLLQRECAGSLQ